jgi:hypothetical protein
MEDIILVPTTAYVIAAINSAHSDKLCVHGSLEETMKLHGRHVHTYYGFKDADYPLYAIETNWSKKNSEEHSYFLCSL